MNGKIVGRLRAEYNASLTICKSIHHHSEGKGKLKLKVHSTKPKYALIIKDPLDDKISRVHVNYYPDEELTRGYVGEHRAIYEQWPDLVDQWVSRYVNLWECAKSIDIN